MMQPITQQIELSTPGVTLSIRREDLLHPVISGNKYRKLKYNLLQAKAENKTTLLTFGGAFSNHIAAVAAASQEYGFTTVGIIRGEELASMRRNSTLEFAYGCGMQLKYVTREWYRNKETNAFVELLEQEFGAFYLLPEGGTNALAVKGCEEILNERDAVFNYICCSAGTGGTAAGISRSATPEQKVLAFAALKGDFLTEAISSFMPKSNFEVVTGYEFGGYGKISADLIEFVNAFKKKYNIALDPIYTGKMLFGVMDRIKAGYFPKGSNILAIHTGGQQGIAGINEILKNKHLPLIATE